MSPSLLSLSRGRILNITHRKLRTYAHPKEPMAVAENVLAKLCRISVSIAYSVTFVLPTIPQSQFIEKGFKKTKDCKHREALLLLLFIHSLICGDTLRVPGS